MRYAVFCGSAFGKKPVYREAAAAMGGALVKKGLGLVYGGGNVGLMGTVADAALAAGGEAVGVIPDFLVARELSHPGLSELHTVSSMHERKALMAELSDGFVALPGGFGTFEEFCEILTWAQLGLHRKPFGLLNVEGYYEPLLRMFDQAVAEGFVRPEHRGIVLESADPEELLEKMLAYEPAFQVKWVERKDLYDKT